VLGARFGFFSLGVEEFGEGERRRRRHHRGRN
jgi:hypothetical protein